MTVGRNGEKQVTDQVWIERTTDGATSTDGPWAELSADAAELDPEEPTIAAPGSMEKVKMLRARYAVGLPLWDERDSYDHGKAAATSAVLNAVSSLSTSKAGVAEDVIEEQGEPLAI